ncbi:MAG: hypothetical protein K6C40_13425 [Thermoguttaceae bacterium]|nr:hypothetical protein [Thermoguttaceae bacterium]
MTSKKNSKTTGNQASESQSVGGGLRKFVQRLCIYGLTLIGMLLIYFVMGGDSRKLAGIKNPTDQTGEAANAGVSHSVGKPVMDENGNPVYQKVSGGWDMYGTDSDEMMSSGYGSELDQDPDPGTALDSDLAAELGLSGSDEQKAPESSKTSESYGSGSTSSDSPMVGNSGSDYSGGSSSDYSSGSSSDYSGGSSYDYSGGSSSDYSGGSSSDYSGGSSSDYSGGSSSDYSGGSSSDYSGGSSSGYSGGSSSDYSGGSSSDYSGGSSSDYSGGSSSGYSGGSSSDYSSSSGYSGGLSSDSSAGLNTSGNSSGANVETSKESLEDFFPKAPPIKDYKEGVVTGPDGNPRRDEVKILEVGRGEPIRNHFGPAVTDFLDLFDFSITPDWIEANWSSLAIVGPLTTRGYRVPISTGPEPSDLVGSLTYYFDSHLELEKITFEGYTGDLDRLLISLKYFNLTKRITSDPNALLYLSEELPGNRRSFLKSYYRLQSHKESEPNKRYWLTIELYPPEK